MRNARIPLLLAVLSAASLVAGASGDPPAPPAELNNSVTPLVTYVHVSGNKSKFREDVWTKDGWTGGVEQFTLQQKLNADWSVRLDGRGVFDNEDYKLRLEIVNPKIGFLRAGFTDWRKYSDDVGGFFKGFSTPSLSLHRDLILRNGDIWVEAGLTLPDLPKLTLGYERQFRIGEQSLLEWGGVTQGSTTRNIAPSFQHLDEHVDIFKAELEHDVKNVHLADQFRFEHYSTDTETFDGAVNLNTAASQQVTVKETYHHDEFFNTFRMDSHVNDKVYWSLGYLYTTLDGSGGVNVMTPPPLGPADKNWLTQAMDVDLDSQVVNLNTMFGPFAGLYLYGGLQAERTLTHGFTDALLAQGVSPATTNLTHSTDDKQSLDETFGLRYIKIPWTTLYAEGRWSEQDIDLSQAEIEDTAPEFSRDTGTSILQQDYRVGFNTAPLPRLTLAGRYRHSIYDNDYSHDVDTEPGYPAFITAQDFTTDEVMTKLNWRACSKLSLAFTYQLVATDIRTTTGDATDPTVLLGPPGRTAHSGNYDAGIYSVSATATPFARLYLTGLFSFQDTRTAVAANSDLSLARYVGNVYTILGTAGYALDNKTDLTLEYTYSRSDNFSDHSAVALPLGLDFQRHGLLVGVSRKIRPNIIARLRYGFYDYHETHTGGIDDYQAHLASASCTVRF